MGKARSFIAKHGGDCGNCGGWFRKGDKIIRLDKPALFEHPKSVWSLRGQYRKVWYAHEICPKV